MSMALEVKTILNKILNFVQDNNINACGLSLEIDAKLTDEAQYYMGTYEEINAGLGVKGNEIMAALS